MHVELMFLFREKKNLYFAVTGLDRKDICAYKDTNKMFMESRDKFFQKIF